MTGDPLEWLGGVWATTCPHDDCDWAKEHSNRAYLRKRLDDHLKTHQQKD